MRLFSPTPTLLAEHSCDMLPNAPAQPIPFQPPPQRDQVGSRQSHPHPETFGARAYFYLCSYVRHRRWRHLHIRHRLWQCPWPRRGNRPKQAIPVTVACSSTRGGETIPIVVPLGNKKTFRGVLWIFPACRPFAEYFLRSIIANVRGMRILCDEYQSR
jgi:hypothetical protein